jgi:hypothetical protein
VHRISLQDGLAFCALLATVDSSLVDFMALKKGETYNNLQLAFNLLEKHYQVPQLLDPSELIVGIPDENSMLTYNHQPQVV